MMVKGVIFDLDGVLVSTDEYHYLSWKRIADKLGIHFDRTINNKLRGISRMESLEIVLGARSSEFDSAQKVAIATEKNEQYRKFLSQMSPSSVAQSVCETLEKIRQAGLKTAIGSSSKNTGYILERTDLAKYFDAVCDGNDITRSKPDPEVFLKAAKFLGLNPAECLVVEDGHSGIDAAKSGGFTAVAIGDATTHKNADFTIKNLNDLLEILNITTI